LVGPPVGLAPPAAAMAPALQRRRRPPPWAALALAQLLSALIAATAVTSERLAVGRGIEAPAFQAFANYCLLAAAYGGPLLQRLRAGGGARGGARGGAPLRQAWGRYAALALIDVEANYLVTR